MKKVFIFDFDGTFYSGEHKFDNVKGNIDKYKRMFLKNISDEEYSRICKENPKWLDVYSGIDVTDFIVFFKDKYKELDISLKEFRDWQQSIIDDVIIDYNQVVDSNFMKELCEIYPVYIVSNSSIKHIKFYMNKLGLDFEWFKEVISNKFLEEDRTKGLYYKDILSKENCNSYDVYVFGDSVIADLAPARHLKMNAFCVYNASDLKDLVNSVILKEF